MRTGCDCMVACFAMIMNWTYEKAKDYFPDRATYYTGYRWEFLIPFLKANGIYFNWFPENALDRVDWSKPAMIDVPSLTAPEKGDHIIFWTGTKVIDPSIKTPQYTKLPNKILAVYQINEKWTKPK